MGGDNSKQASGAASPRPGTAGSPLPPMPAKPQASAAAPVPKIDTTTPIDTTPAAAGGGGAAGARPEGAKAVEQKLAAVGGSQHIYSTLNRKSLADCETREEKDAFNYTKLRDDLLAFSLGEASYQYAERLNRETPDNPPVMALLGETAFLYEKLKNKGRREHWVDRCDVLQRGIDISRKCMHDHPDYGPCYRSYVLCACKMADTETWFKRGKPLSLFKHYARLQTIGDRALELYPTADVAMYLASVSGRCATRLRHWYSPWHPVARFYNLPWQRDMLLRSKEMLESSLDQNPNSLECACRYAETLYELGELNKARRWYIKVRDEMTSEDPDDSIWQTVSHTHLVAHFDKPSWNLPFG